MNFWLLAFAIGYPPKLLQNNIVELLSRNGKPFFTQITNFISSAIQLFGRLCMANASRRKWMLATSTVKSRRGSSWRCFPSRPPNDRLKLRAHRRSQFIYDLEKIHFGQPLRTPQQKGQRTRGFGSRIVFANPVE